MRAGIISVIKRIWANRRSRWFRYSLPLVLVFGAFLSHILIASLLGNAKDSVFTLFYLLAAFASAWLGGFVPGAMACVLVMVGIPFAFTPGFRLSNIEPPKLLGFIAVSALISSVERSQRRLQGQLRASNEELDERVAIRTRELADAVRSLEKEVEINRLTAMALRDSEQRVDFTLDAAQIGRWDLDLATGIVTRSERLNKILGSEADTALWTKTAFLDHLVAEDRVTAGASLDEAVSSGGSFEMDVRIPTANDGPHWIWMLGKVQHDAGGRPIRMLGSVRNITARKTAESRLQTQLERLQLLDHITRGIGERQDLRSIFQVVIRSLEANLRIDFGCVCLYEPSSMALNVTCVGLNNVGLADELTIKECDLVPIDQNGLSQCVQGRLVYEPDVSEVEFAFPQRMARGGMRSMVAAPLLSEKQVFGVLIAARRQANSFTSAECEFLRQLSEHVGLASHQAQIREALQKAYNDLQQSQEAALQQERLRALGQMASGIAHDINNAISPVALYTESLLESEPDLSARTRQYLETTLRAIEDVAETVARMREFYRQQEPQLVLTAVQLGALVPQVLDLTHARWSDMAQRRGATIQATTELAPDLPAIWGIESEIREALINLIINAVDAMPKGGTLTVRTRFVLAELRTPQVYLEVSDTGLGMDDDTRRRCLEPFFTTKGERGTGLGLAMVYGVAQRHNAQIELDSAPGKGTTARIVFPVPDAPIEVAAPEAPVEIARPRMRILVVDDDPLLIRSLRDTLDNEGHTVTTAHGGNEGIAAFRASVDAGEPFALVITDLGMPYVDGRAVAAAVKEVSLQTPVILLTGWGQRLVAEGDVPPHVDKVLSKPPKLRDLRTAIAECTASVNPEIPPDFALLHSGFASNG